MADKILYLKPTNVRYWIEREQPTKQEDLTVDFTCKYSHSHQLRCAVNPNGPCKGCGDYEAIATKNEITPPYTTLAIDAAQSNDERTVITCVQINENGERRIKQIRFNASIATEIVTDNRQQYSIGYTCNLTKNE